MITVNITVNQLEQVDNDFVKFCKDNHCLNEAYETLKDIYNNLEDFYTIVEFNVVRDFNDNLIKIGHIEDMSDIHLCNTCYDHYGHCKNKGTKGICTQPISDEVLKIACETLDETGDCHGFYKHVCRDIMVYFRTPFVRDDEF